VIERIGNCRIIEEIASGGTAVLYRAVQESMNRTVAVKALKTAVAAESHFAVRFEREALSLAQLQHENIIHVYDYLLEKGARFIVMEYVEGIDLYDLLERCVRLPADVAAIIAMQVARALDYAHYRGIVHRDIKPGNILVSRSGGVKLTDFGIARDAAFGDLTEAGTALGTPAYMSPEQVLGDRLDGRSDLFSLGTVLYQMVTGKKPFVEDNERSVMHKIRLERPTAPRRLAPDIPRELERIIMRCLQKRPRDRFRSTQDLVLALERFIARRVEINVHARLVHFLAARAVITREQADEYLHPAMTGGPAIPAAANHPVVRHGAVVLAGFAVVASIAIALIHLTAPPSSQTAAAAPAVTLAPLRVVAEPWAEIWIDGQRAGITPLAEPLEVAEGWHRVVLRNPYYAPTTRLLEVRGEGTSLTVALTGRTAPVWPTTRPASLRAALPPPPPPYIHIVRPGDTLEYLAAELYGSRDLAVFLMLANGMSHERPLRAGERLTVPTTWRYTAVEGDTLALLAEAYLGDPRRAPFLASWNGLPDDATLAEGQEVTIPFHEIHVAADVEDLEAIAAAFYRDRGKAELLASYNFRAPKLALRRGDSIIVPIVDVNARLPGDRAAERMERRRRAAGARAVRAIERADAAFRAGDYAAVKGHLLDLDDQLLDADTAARAALLLGSAYVAFGDTDSALSQLRRARDRRRDLVLRADEVSPKVAEVWQRAGGRVEEPR
jgi:eukaryotic-like serine/threonine-protein kinase